MEPRNAWPPFLKVFKIHNQPEVLSCWDNCKRSLGKWTRRIISVKRVSRRAIRTQRPRLTMKPHEKKVKRKHVNVEVMEPKSEIIIINNNNSGDKYLENMMKWMRSWTSSILEKIGWKLLKCQGRIELAFCMQEISYEISLLVVGNLLTQTSMTVGNKGVWNYYCYL